MSIRTTKLPNGERLLFVAADPFGIPDLWIAGYVLKRLRGRLTYDSIRHHLEGITKGIRFCKARNIADLRTMACGQHLDDDFLSSFADYCRKRDDGAGAVLNAGQTYSAFLAYFLWLGEQPTAAPRDPHLVTERSARLKERIDSFAPTKSAQASVRLGLSEEQRDLFLRAIIPSGPDNPFGPSAFRNFALMGTAFMHGLRSGELLGLKVEDLSLNRGVGSIRVVLRPNDPDDPRHRPAAQKTLARVIPTAEDMTQILTELLVHRSALKVSSRHPYVFCNAEGYPLGDRGLRKAYSVLRQRHPRLNALINHQLRHDWNDRWMRLVKEKGWDLNRALNAQLHNNGWTPGSLMPGHYARLATEEIAGVYLLEAQRHGLYAFARPQK